METKENVSASDSDITDLNNKMFIVFKVLQSCMKEKDRNKRNIETTLDKLVSFTGLPKHILSKICDKTKIPEPVNVQNLSGFESPEIDVARKALITHYVKNRKIPSLKSLTETSYNASPLEIRQLLKRSGFIWKRVPNTKRAIIIESPERVIQRQRYLEQMDCYRQQKRCIVYIENKIIDKYLPEYNYFKNHTKYQNEYVVLIAAATKTGFIGGTIFAGPTLSKCQELCEYNIIKNILPRLANSSVIILEDNLSHCTNLSMSIPTIESEKSSMIRWLNINNIPYDESSHRSELLELIENCNIKSDLNKFDAIVYARGLEILRRPQKTYYLNYFQPLWRDLFKSQKTVTNDMIKNKPPEYWLHLENNLIAYEKVVYKEDLDMENVIDKILTMAQYAKNIGDINIWADADCDEVEGDLET